MYARYKHRKNRRHRPRLCRPPACVEFGKKSSVVGFDINQPGINALKAGYDTTLEVSDEELAEAKHLSYIANLEELKDCNVYIVTVPTPINEHKQPDLTSLIKTSEAIDKLLKLYYDSIGQCRLSSHAPTYSKLC